MNKLDQLAFRQALGRFVTGVCVITTNVKDQNPIGLTANSFASVSLDPPLVLWSIQKNSDCFDCFADSQYYGVNILSDSQQSLSSLYAQKNTHDLLPGSYRIGRSGCPVLKQVLVSFECKIKERHEGGDHIILVAEVVELTAKPTGKPLVFYSGRYREVK